MKTPPWFQIALKECGVKEVAGEPANPRILLYHAITTLRATSDEVAWCSSFVSWCLEKAGVPSTRSAAARSYTNWGVALREPFLGCIVVLSRGGDPTKGHVGFWVAENDESVFIWGGNQGNMVSLQAYDKRQILSYRAPDEKHWGQNGTH